MSSEEDLKKIQTAPQEDLRRRDERDRVRAAPDDDLRDAADVDEDPEPGRIKRARERARRRARKATAKAKARKKQAQLQTRQKRRAADQKIPETAKRVASKAGSAVVGGASAALAAADAADDRGQSSRDDVRRVVEGAADAAAVSPVVGDATLQPVGGSRAVAEMAKAGPPRARGGRSQLEAMASGTAALSFGGSDGNQVLSFDMGMDSGDPGGGLEFSDDLAAPVGFDSESIIESGFFETEGGEDDNALF